ncbi:hypothetical protein CEXT_675431 [Caerostris extrusa]|uniref:Uncharacterized protein n=1 Tax=Caerostris extrusa TaxID=172846 RepID=A0AAV4ST89_CAEEX|nr:hypothetical protein CEXT_675431 [Caerostris extrusa]
MFGNFFCTLRNNYPLFADFLTFPHNNLRILHSRSVNISGEPNPVFSRRRRAVFRPLCRRRACLSGKCDPYKLALILPALIVSSRVCFLTLIPCLSFTVHNFKQSHFVLMFGAQFKIVVVPFAAWPGNWVVLVHTGSVSQRAPDNALEKDLITQRSG